MTEQEMYNKVFNIVYQANMPGFGLSTHEATGQIMELPWTDLWLDAANTETKDLT